MLSNPITEVQNGAQIDFKKKIDKFTTVVRDFNTPFSITDSYISSVINYIYSKIKGPSLYLIF